jgi:hypothetical protein
LFFHGPLQKENAPIGAFSEDLSPLLAYPSFGIPHSALKEMDYLVGPPGLEPGTNRL